MTDLIIPLDGTRIQVAGLIEVDRRTQTVRVPAVVNQTRGLVEYLLVHTKGKRHEALLATSVEAQHVHLACLLAGAPETDTAARAVSLTITWQGHGHLRQLSPEALLSPATNDGMPIADEATAPGRWSYHGSRFTGGHFAAQHEGNLIALQVDASALMQAPGLQAREFVPSIGSLPAVGTPVTLIITFSSPVAREVP